MEVHLYDEQMTLRANDSGKGLFEGEFPLRCLASTGAGSIFLNYNGIL